MTTFQGACAKPPSPLAPLPAGGEKRRAGLRGEDLVYNDREAWEGYVRDGENDPVIMR